MAARQSSALNAVVDGIVQSSVAGRPLKSTNDDVDKYVANLILKEAADNEKKYGAIGIKALRVQSTEDRPIRQPNKRFLSSVIRDVDEHNQALLRHEAHAVERSKSRSRSKSPHRSSRHHRSHRHRSDRSRTEERKHRHHDSDHRQHRSRRSRSISRSKSPRARRRRSPSPIAGSSNQARSRPQQDLSIIRKVQGNAGSPMDKYFEKDYDPRLDITPQTDKRGFVVDFGEWDSMLEAVRGRKSRKEENRSHRHHRDAAHHKGQKSAAHPAMALQYSKGPREWDRGKPVKTDGHWEPPTQTFVKAKNTTDEVTLYKDSLGGDW